MTALGCGIFQAQVISTDQVRATWFRAVRFSMTFSGSVAVPFPAMFAPYGPLDHAGFFVDKFMRRQCRRVKVEEGKLVDRHSHNSCRSASN